MIKYVENVEEFNELIKEGKVLVDFFATWCGPCKMLSPVLEEVSKELTETVFVKVDIDKVEELPKQFGIMSVPTLLLFNDGELTKTSLGYIGKEELIKLIND